MSSEQFFDQVPHANVPLERSSLGHMLAFRRFGSYVGAGLQVSDFHKAAHRHIFDAIEAVEGTGVDADERSVSLELRRRGVLEEVGPTYLSRLTAEVVPPTESAIVASVAELSELAARRELRYAVESEPLETIAARLDRSMQRGPDDRRIYDAAAQLQTIREDIQRDKQGRIWLGFPTLDNILDGIRPGEVMGLMARPGIGKTLVLCHITRCTAEMEFGHVMFSLEMPAAQIVQRLASAHYGVGRYHVRERLDSGALEVADYEQNFARFVLVDSPGLDVARMAAKLRQIQAGPLKGIPIRLVTIDHLGLIGGDRKMSTYDRVSTQARELKELAKRFNVTVLLAVQVNREAGGDGSKELGLGSARDSGVVEEAMDYLVAMRRPDRSQSLGQAERKRYQDVLFAKVVKNRHGAPDREIAIRINSTTLDLSEDPNIVIEADDLSRIAASAGRRR